MEARIVVIANDETDRKFFAWCLGRAGYQVGGYAYAGFDLAMLEALPPDLIILNFGRDDNGAAWGLLQLLKMADTMARIPILVIAPAVQLSVEIRSYLRTRNIRMVLPPFDLAPFLMAIQETLTAASQASVLFSSDHPLPILVVDDTDLLRETITTILRFEGYGVVTAANGLIALETISCADYCLILLDISMPIMNGYEFLSVYERQLRSHTPVIIVSGEMDVQEHILPNFVMGVLPKPYPIRHLLDMVEKYALPV
jgi:two-component system response regulator MprA